MESEDKIAKITWFYDETIIDTETLLTPSHKKENAHKAIVLNELATVIYNKIKEMMPFSKILCFLLETYDIDKEKLSNDFDKCINDFIKLNVIEIL